MVRFVVGIWRLAVAGLALFAIKDVFTPGGFKAMTFFTTQSNLLIVVVLLWAGLASLLNGDEPPAWLKGGATLYISITALVSAFILDPELPGNPQVFLGFTETGIKHILIPILAVVDFLIADRHRRYRWTFPSWWLLYPVLYMVFTTVRGGFWPHVGYPYGFIDVSEIGYGGLCLNIVIYGAGFWMLGAALVSIDKLLPKRALLRLRAR